MPPVFANMSQHRPDLGSTWAPHRPNVAPNMSQEWCVLLGLDTRPKKNTPFLAQHRLNIVSTWAQKGPKPKACFYHWHRNLYTAQFGSRTTFCCTSCTATLPKLQCTRFLRRPNMPSCPWPQPASGRTASRALARGASFSQTAFRSSEQTCEWTWDQMCWKTDVKPNWTHSTRTRIQKPLALESKV